MSTEKAMEEGKARRAQAVSSGGNVEGEKWDWVIGDLYIGWVEFLQLTRFGREVG